MQDLVTTLITNGDTLGSLSLQAATPSLDTWVALLAAVGPAFAGIFGALLWAQRQLDAARVQQIAALESRIARAETREDAAMTRLATTTSTVTDLSGAVREFAVIGRTTIEEVKKNGDRTETALRRMDGMERTLADLAYQRSRPAPDRSEPGQ